jgi:hypothetical protein
MKVDVVHLIHRAITPSLRNDAVLLMLTLMTPILLRGAFSFEALRKHWCTTAQLKEFMRFKSVWNE